jgi:serine/threonine-protein kinase
MTAVAPPARRVLAPGARIGGKYLLEQRLGRGGMAEVWQATNEATGGEVAVKVCRAGDDEVTEERFRHEARLSARLAHRNVARVYDLVEDADDGTLFLVMERLRGETLQARLEREKTLPAQDVVAIAVEVLAGLGHAHDVGVVHRDVTPANVFLAVDPDGRMTPKLIDFGVAKAPHAPVKTADGRALGTPEYMSPEQIRLAQLDGRSDLFSLGLVMYQCITGTNPFLRRTASASLAAVLEVPVDPHEAIPPRLWMEIERSLRKQAYERFATAEEMASALRSAVSGDDRALDEALQGQRLPVTPYSQRVSSAASRAASRSAPSLASAMELDRPAAPPTSAEIVPQSSRAVRLGLLVGGVALLLLAGGIGYVAARGDRGAANAARPSASPSTAASPTATTPPTAEPTSTTADLDPVPTAASTTPHVVRPPATTTRKPPHGTKPVGGTKPVATTPGF